MIKKSDFGKTSQGEATLYTITNHNGMEMQVTDFGATLVSVKVPGKDGELCDVVHGFTSAAEYEANLGSWFGATVGRFANRIAGASFELNGKTYTLTANNNNNSLHGGRDFYSGRKWTATLERSQSYITFILYSPDGDQGYPGGLDIQVTYELTDDNEVKISYHAVSDADTIINLTNHSFFNVSGNGSGTVLDQEVWIDADTFTRADEKSIPTGELVDVTGTPMDFRTKKTIGQDIDMDYEALNFGQGYDHNYVLNNKGEYKKVAEMHSNTTGITMEVYTDLPGIQLYTGNFIDGTVAGKDGVYYQRRSGACFETQYFPDCIHYEQFEGPVLNAEEVFHSVTAYKFITTI